MKCQKLTKIFFYYGCVQVSTFFAAFFSAIFDICNGNIDVSAWNLPVPVELPFDIKSIFGWFLNWFFQFGSGTVYSFCMILTTTHFVCFCYYIIATCKHFDLFIESLHADCDKIEKEKNTQKHPKMWSNVRENLQHIVEIHINIYKWENAIFCCFEIEFFFIKWIKYFDRIFKMIVKIESGIILSLLPFNVLLMSTALYTTEHVNICHICIMLTFYYAGFGLFPCSMEAFGRVGSFLLK